MGDKPTGRPTQIRRVLNGLDAVTFGLTGRFATWFDEKTEGAVTGWGHRELYRMRQFGLRVRAATAARDLRLLAGPRSRDIAVAEGGDRPTELRDPRQEAEERMRKRAGRQTILFASEMRPTLAGNLLSIYERMCERGLDSEFDIRFSFRTLDQVTQEGTAQLASELAAADIILIDDYFPLLNKVTLRHDQKLIQVWHAGSGFKSVGYSRFGNYGSPRLTDTHRKYTFAICGSTHLVPVYAEVFGIPEDAVIPTGLPRIDSFLDPVRSERVKADFADSYPQLEGRKKILFAPTFRGEGAKSAFYDYSRLDFERIYEMCGDEYVFLMRMHHFVAGAPPIPAEYADRILDFSHFPNGNDLLHSIDILITDYSSILYEFSLLDRPMLFFAYDKDLYSATRGFHRDYDEMAPGKVCNTFDELIQALETADFEEWKVERFREENFDHIDTDSSDRVIDQLILDDPRNQPEAIEAAEREIVRFELARRLGAEQFHVDHPDHVAARNVVADYLRLDSAVEETAEDSAVETPGEGVLSSADDREVLT
ncbi:CDP-glycerol glycerophosphotransferase family protein [Microbacterium sp. ARD32]|uniref:CDP-glycerol glycerophosphotransferase family protein n=1 Tax=Microbacterium sp. ARD32 TaxID=2962577 RepID=UPI002882CCF8|nr:CDP-glycerol glycerophosphotransferase family protein [Microbacterium sp. ARD32]MDT0156399.1 CDP-glycerol glycerophosphotransferase family protein [Microbacterium sp. ARD32]